MRNAAVLFTESSGAGSFETIMLLGFARWIRIVLATSLAVGTSACWQAGQAPNARSGFERAKPILAALAKYRDQQGYYPATLESLVPQYLPASALGATDTTGRVKLMHAFQYESLGASFELRFQYTGPGSNQCIYRSTAPKWECSGKF